MKYNRITINPMQMDGMPCIRGMRIPVATIINMVAQDISREDILRFYPDLEKEDIQEALEFAADMVRERTLPLITSNAA
ncbi:MAG: DUF433 domain-containing protein [Saprospiraceae bacterium]|jgi:uncharacterized protein (DUF433 family)|nr:DUF433 domain-containing protein [Saprospiraceae bacterium]